MSHSSLTPVSLSHFTTRDLSCDVFVAGGGLSGVSCALAAARLGARTILCQDRPVLGGNASSEVRMHVVGANFGRPCRALELEARETGIIEEIRLENAMRNPQRSPSLFDFILYEKCRSESNLTLLLNTSVVAARVERDSPLKRVTAVEAIRTSTEDRFVISAQSFVDCTGDGGMAFAAGAAFLQGREDKARFGEPSGLDVADRKTLGSTLLFMARRHDRPMPFVPPPWARKFTEDDLRLRAHAASGVDRGLEYGYWWLEWGGQLDTIKDNEEIRDELLAILMGVWDHIKNQPGHGAEHWALEWFGFLPGKRESRRFIGQHVLTETDVMESRPFEDAIAYGGWPLDTHPPEGVDRPDALPCTQVAVPKLYDIPLRSCIARDFSNMLFAGRNFSATHQAFASTRVMATCSVVGQGVGAAAALAASRGIPPALMPSDPESLQLLRETLLGQDAFLIGRTFEDARNLAHRARLSASSARPDGPVENLLSGQTRCVNGERGAPRDRQHPGTHRWISAPEGDSWIRLDWETPAQVAEIVLVFDTGLHRHLTLTQSDSYARSMYWGCGQPETIRDFSVEGRNAQGAWRMLTEVRDQYQRIWKWRPSTPLLLASLRIRFLGTWANEARPPAEAFDGEESAPPAQDFRVMRLSVYPPTKS